MGLGSVVTGSDRVRAAVEVVRGGWCGSWQGHVWWFRWFQWGSCVVVLMGFQ